jgi:hypothetical protein
MLAQAAKGEFGAAWLLLTAADFHSSFFNRRFLPSLCVAIVMGCRFILFTVSKKGPISNSGLSKRRLFNSIQLISSY